MDFRARERLGQFALLKSSFSNWLNGGFFLWALELSSSIGKQVSAKIILWSDRYVSEIEMALINSSEQKNKVQNVLIPGRLSYLLVQEELVW